MRKNNCLRRRRWICAFAFIIALSGFLSCAPRELSGPEYYRNEYQVFCRENDAVVLASSGFVSTGKIYWLVKENGEWKLAQILDLKPYLKSRHTVHLLEDDKLGGARNRSLQYNDRWLVVGLNRHSAGNMEKNFRDGKGAALIFKNENGRWNFHYDVTELSPFLGRKGLALIEDELFALATSPDLNDKKKRVGRVRRLDLSAPQPVWCEDVASASDSKLWPWNVYATGERLAVDYVDVMSFYRRDGDAWKLSERIPSYDKVNEITENEIVFVDFDETKKRKTYRYVWANERWTLAQTENRPNEAYPVGNEPRLCRQLPGRYSLCWQGKGERFGVAKPSPDDMLHYVEPRWLIEDADPETYRLVSDYYKHEIYGNYSEAKADVVRYAKTHGYDSFYDFLDYIPSVDYAISGNTLVTSHMFLDCWFPGDPMAKAGVWAGVNIYEIDPVTGPKKVFALTTRNFEDLKPVAVGDAK